MIALKQCIKEINKEKQKQTKMKIKRNECNFVCDTNVKLMKHMKVVHTENTENGWK